MHSAGIEPAGRTVRNLQKTVKVRPSVCPASKKCEKKATG